MSENTPNQAAWDSDNLEGAFDFLFGDDDFEATFEDHDSDSEEEFVLESDTDDQIECDAGQEVVEVNCDDCLVEDTTDCSTAD